MSKKSSTFAAIIKITIMTVTQPTINEVFDLACMLPRQEQQELVQKVQYVIHLSESSSAISKEELLARLEHADARINDGHYVEHEDAKQHFYSRIAQKSTSL